MELPPGVEIGAAREEELDAVLRVMCEAFAMPYEAAAPIYYADPELDPARKWVLRLERRVVSCLTFVERECWIGPAVIPFVGIAGVATLFAHRRQGYAGLLLQAAVRTLSACGVPLSLLTATAPDYYRRFGWEDCGLPIRTIFPRQMLAEFHPLHGVRAAVPEDAPALSRLYRSFAEEKAVYCLRDERCWLRLLEQVPNVLIYAPEGEEAQGYLLFDALAGRVALSPTQKASPPMLRVQEMRTETPAARRALFGMLAAQTAWDQVAWDADLTDLRDLDWWERSEKLSLLQYEETPPPLARITDFGRLMSLLAPHWPLQAGSLLLTLEDPLLQSPVCVRIDCDGETPWRSASSSAAPGGVGCEEVSGDVRAWSQIAAGHLTNDPVRALDRLRASSFEARLLLKSLFPARSPQHPVPDHF